MAKDAALSWLIIASSLTPWLVAFAVVAWRRVSRSTRRAKRQASPEPTPPSAPHWAEVAADQAELSSAVAKLTTTVKRLSSRKGMEDLRERRAEGEAPPKGTSKAELLRHYGMSGKVGPAFAQAQLQLERDRDETQH